MTGRQFADAGEGRRRIGHITEREKIGDRSQVDLAFDAGVLQNRFDLRAEDQRPARQGVMQRLFADAVTSQEETALAPVPDGEGEHPTQSLDASLTFVLIKMRDGFSVCSCAQLVAAREK